MNNKIIASNNDIVFYKKDNGDTKIELLINGETLWVSQKTMAEIFEIDRTVITKHLKNIFNDGELDKNQVCANFAHTANDGKKYNTEFYNLDAIISVGYRVNSKKATQFRMWATKILNSYMTKGFALDDERFLKGEKVNKKLTHKQAIEKANEEYEKFRVKQDMQYISSMDDMYHKYLEENKPSQ